MFGRVEVLEGNELLSWITLRALKFMEILQRLHDSHISPAHEISACCG